MVLVFVKRANGSVHALSVESGDVIDWSNEDGFGELDVSILTCKLAQLVHETPKERVLAAMAKITGRSPPADQCKSDLGYSLREVCLQTQRGPSSHPYMHAVHACNAPLIQTPYLEAAQVKVSMNNLDDRLRLEFKPSGMDNMSVEWSLPAKEDFDASLDNFGCLLTSAVGTRHTGLTWNELIPVMTIDELENFCHFHGWASDDMSFKAAGLHDSHPMLFRHPVLQRLLWFCETLKDSLNQWEDHLHHDVMVNYAGDLSILHDAVAQRLRARDH